MDFTKYNGRGHTAIDMEKLISSYQPRESKGLSISSESCIFKIPSILSRHNKKAYSPNAFSFGPWHHGKTRLQFTHALKVNYLKELLRRFPDPIAKLLELEDAVTKMKEKARQCYAEQLGLKDDREFVRILLLDGCFIIELFLKYDEVKVKSTSPDPDDPIFGMACMLQFLYHDLILLENQIPWIVLKRIFDLTIKQSADIELHQLAINFFGKIFTSDGLSVENDLLETNELKHILDLLWEILFLSYLANRCKGTSSGPQTKTEERDSDKHLPSASRLREAGIKFKKESGSKGIFAITFHDGVLEIPSLLIHDTTETIFRNLIAYEQCSYRLEPMVTSYAKLMDNLIDKVDDLHILWKKGIILNSMSSEDATRFFNKLYNDACISHSHYCDIYKEVNSYCRQRWPRWRAAYIHNYFGKPWAIASQLFALIILILTILQVVTAFFQKK